ncbi:hsp90 co-chaperone Cdc37 [Cystobasidiomycetes sp. EMM_F5]
MGSRQIHEKREERKGKIAFLKSEIELNNTLEPRIDEVIAGTSKEGSAYFERKVAELAVTKNDPNAARPPTGRADQPSYDDMVHALMTTVADEVRKKNIKETEDRSKELEKVLREHRKQLSQRTEQCHKEIEAEEAERRKHITSEDLHDGFSVGVSRIVCLQYSMRRH